MADEKKISGLTEASDASASDEFVVVNKDVTTGQDASASGQTSKITLDNLRNAILGGSSGSTGNDVVFGGNVGIGTSNPDVAKLNIKTGGTASSSIYVQNSLDQVVLNFYEDTQSNSVLLMGDKDGWDDVTKHPKIRLSTGGQNSYILAGNFGIGTDSPVTLLDLNQPKDDLGGNPLNKDVIISFSKGDTGEARIGLAGMTSQVLLGALTNDLCIRSDGNNIRFGTASATRTDMTINSDGNVGIGTDSPASELHIENNAPNHDTTLKIENRNGNSGGTAIEFQGYRDVDADHWVSKIKANHENSTAHGGLAMGANLEFYTQNGHAESDSPRMTIDQNGNVGIGTSSPRVRFEVVGSSDKLYAAADGINDLPSASVTIENGSTLGNSSANLNFYHGGGGSSISRIASLRTNTSKSALAFITQGTTGRKEQMRIDSEGNVGIGTSDPHAKLDITDDPISSDVDLSPRKVLCLKRPDVSTTTYAQRVNFFVSKYEGNETAGVSTHSRTQLDIALSHSKGENGEVSNVDGTNERVGGTQVMTLRSDGNVGIGTASPEWLLDLAQKDGGCQLQLGRTNTNIGSAWMGADGNGFHLGVGAYLEGGGTVANPKGFTVDTNGNVGIGGIPVDYPPTTTALQLGARAHICATDYGHLNIVQNAYQDATNTKNLRYVHGKSARYRQYDGEHIFSHTTENGPGGDDSNDSEIEWKESMRIDNAGRVGIGHGTPSYPLDIYYSSAGPEDHAVHLRDLTDRQDTKYIRIDARTSPSVSTALQLGGLKRNGTTAGVQLWNGSDARMKTNVTDADSILDKLNECRVVEYNMKWDGDGQRHLGVLAQELVEVFPEMVDKTDDGTGDIDPEKGHWTVGMDWEYKLLKAIQELSAKNDELSAKVDELSK